MTEMKARTEIMNNDAVFSRIFGMIQCFQKKQGVNFYLFLSLRRHPEK
jgi:hypothetical protein